MQKGVVIFVIVVLISFCCFLRIREIRNPTSAQVPHVKLKRGNVQARKQRIPRRIMQTHKSTTVSQGTARAMKTIVDANPDYDYEFVDDAKAKRFLAKHFHPRVLGAFNKIIPGSFKADLFRYCYLFIKGGVYLDADMEALAPLDNIISPEDEFVSYADMSYISSRNGIYQAFLACEPRHPVMQKAIEMSVNNIEMEIYGPGPLSVTGPTMCGMAFLSAVGKTPKSGNMEGLLGGNIYLGKIRRFKLQDKENKSTFKMKHKYKAIEDFSLNHYGVLWYFRKIFRKSE